MCYSSNLEDDRLFWINSEVDHYLNQEENRLDWYEEDCIVDSEGAF